MRNRKDILFDIVYLNDNIELLQKEINQYSWDMEIPILVISKRISLML